MLAYQFKIESLDIANHRISYILYNIQYCIYDIHMYIVYIVYRIYRNIGGTESHLNI